MPPNAERVEQVFSGAAALPPGPERSAYLSGACGEDRALRDRVEALLASHDAADSFLLRPANPDDASTVDEPGRVAEGPGTRIGRYKLLQLIGEGGFGSVFMAEQEHPVRRKVALKIIKLGMDTRQVIARFEAERQALALMDHPNIAKVLDAGATETGRPYFVMELVRGVPITEYCDTNNLPTRERLELFVPVCHAVQHAHQKGIIHRDIKPSNILVTMADGNPIPKVIDFGIAKATSARLTEKTLFTEFRQLIGTPEYMSPEQAEMSGIDVDTRTDVYSLGVLLYELLTGTTPFDPQELRSKAYAEIQRMIREVEPPRPSTRVGTLGPTLTTVAAHRRVEPRKLGQLMRGELDWIVMKAMEKDRTRRYETANGMVMDVRRYLDGEPVQARPSTFAYRMSKFARKHWAAAAAATAVAAALVLGIAGTTFGLVRARHARAAAVADRDSAVAARAAEADQRRAAETAGREVAEAAALVRDMFSPRYLTSPLLPATLQSVEARLAAGWLRDRPDTRATVHAVLAGAYGRSADFDRAERHLQVALELNRSSPGDRRREIADVLMGAGQVARARQDYPAAKARLREAIEVARSLASEEPSLPSFALGELKKLREEQQDFDETGRLDFELGKATMASLSAAVERIPNNRAYLLRAAYTAATVGEFELATKHFQRLTELTPEDHFHWYRLVALRAYLGDMAGYRRDRLKMLERFGDDSNPAVAERTAKVWLIVPPDDADLGRLEAMANRPRPHEQGHTYAPWWRATRGMAEYRAGRFERAAELLASAALANTNMTGRAEAEIFLAMALQRLGRADEARLALGTALHRLDRLSKPGVELMDDSFHDWLICHTVLREAQPLVGPVDAEAEWVTHLTRDADAKAAELGSGGNSGALLAVRAELLARAGRFDEAAAALDKSLEAEGRIVSRALLAAALHRYRGDAVAYRAAREHMTRWFGTATDPIVCEMVAKALTLAPCESDDLTVATGSIDRCLAGRGKKHIWGYIRVTKGMTEYRRGNFEASIDWLTRPREDWDHPAGEVLADSFLAMAYHRAGQLGDARASLTRASDRATRELPAPGRQDLAGPHYLAWDWLAAQVALREAKATLAAATVSEPGVGAAPSEARAVSRQ